MTTTMRWDPCVFHRGPHTERFLRTYLANTDRATLLIAAAGFDPRSTRFAEIVANASKGTRQAILLREERPDPPPVLTTLAEEHQAQMQTLFPTFAVHSVNIFAQDHAVVGGRAAARLISNVSLSGFTDVFLDASALSIGVAFPIVRHLLSTANTLPAGETCNIHVVCCDDPALDGLIHSTPSGTASPIHGFRGDWGLESKSQAAVLWMPQLSRRKKPVLRQIFQALRNEQPDTVVCPILPFPASQPRLSDDLIEEFADELQSAWQVDARDMIFADEKSPLDLYRTILRIDDARRRVFESVGGSQIILSPLGSKALSLGALMAALDRDFTILYVESIGYSGDAARLQQANNAGTSELVHIWLHGDAYGSQSTMEGAPP